MLLDLSPSHALIAGLPCAPMPCSCSRQACPVLWGRHAYLRGADVAGLWIECYVVLFQLYRAEGESARDGSEYTSDLKFAMSPASSGFRVDVLYSVVAGTDLPNGMSLASNAGPFQAPGSGQGSSRGSNRKPPPPNTGQLVSATRLRGLAR